MTKKIITKKKFLELNFRSANQMSKDKKLFRNKIDVLSHADKYRWIHQSSWLGEPILNLPQDMFAIQEIIYATRPKYFIEVI